MKEIAHRVDKNHARFFPVERLQEALGADSKIKTIFERVAGHAAEAFGEPGGIAIVASRADLGAAGDRVPCRVGPLDGAFFRHDHSNRRRVASQPLGSELKLFEFRSSKIRTFEADVSSSTDGVSGGER
jgi:hypothetical protein